MRQYYYIVDKNLKDFIPVFAVIVVYGFFISLSYLRGKNLFTVFYTPPKNVSTGRNRSHVVLYYYIILIILFTIIV